MKTNFPQRNRVNSSFKGRILYSVFVFVVAWIFFSYLGSGLFTLASPVWRSDTSIKRALQNGYLSLRSKDHLIRENETLKRDLQAQNELLLSLQSISSSRDELLLSYGREQIFYTPASVLVHPPKTPYDILVLDVGENGGVKLGSLVTEPGGTLLGTIVEVFSKTSKVRLYTTSGERTDALLERGSVPVELRGRGGGNFVLTVPREAPVEIGDRILSPHLDASLLAVVGDIETSPTDAFKTVYARAPSTPTSLTKVLIK